VLRITAAGLLMGLIVWGVSLGIEGLVEPIGLARQVLVLAIPIAVGGAAYLGFAYLFRVSELDGVKSLVRSRHGV
jgi:hypothetical protein